MEHANENFVDGEMTIQYLFVEKAAVQIEIINADQGWITGSFTFRLGQTGSRHPVASLRSEIEEEIGYIMRSYGYFKEVSFDVNDYQYCLVYGKNQLKKFGEISAELLDALDNFAKNLLIVAKNFNPERFLRTDIYQNWITEYGK